jgi:hypothetical protein
VGNSGVGFEPAGNSEVGLESMGNPGVGLESVANSEEREARPGKVHCPMPRKSGIPGYGKLCIYIPDH